jgi:hypothetical protein
LEPGSFPEVHLFLAYTEEHVQGMQYLCDPCVKREWSSVKGLKHLPVVREFADVFPEELPGMSSERELDFTIDLKLGTEPIARIPYQMSTREL